MQSQKPTDPTKYCEDFLVETKIRYEENDILLSERKIIDRLLARKIEMQEVYKELYEKLAGHHFAIDAFLRLILNTSAFSNPEQISKAREQFKEIEVYNKEIAAKSESLSNLIRRRDELFNSSGCSYNVHYSVCCVLKAAGKNNHHFNLYLEEPLSCICSQYDDRYWPSLEDFLTELSEDSKKAEVVASSPITEAAMIGRASNADYFKALLQAIEGSRDLPLNFKVTDRALATIGNCALDFGPDQLIDETYVKGIRQRIREKNMVE